MTPEEAADLVAACEAERVALALSASGDNIQTHWPGPEVADRLRPEVIRNRAVVLEVLAWPRCVRCLHRCRRVVAAYWGEDLCSRCCAVRVAAHDELGAWPPTPWPAEPTPEWPPPPRRKARRHPPPPEFHARSRRHPERPLHPDGSETCPACRPHPWNPGRLCPRHIDAYRLGRALAGRQTTSEEFTP